MFVSHLVQKCIFVQVEVDISIGVVFCRVTQRHNYKAVSQSLDNY